MTTPAETKKTNDKPAPEVKKAPLTVLQAIRADILVIEKALKNKDSLFVSKILKKVRGYKNRLNSFQLGLILDAFEIKDVDVRKFSDFQENAGETFEIPKERASKLITNLEVEIYVHTLILIHLVKQNQISEARQLAENLVKKATQANKRHLDNISSIIYFFYSHTSEKLGKSKEIRNELFDLYRNSCLKRDEIGQATLLNLLLRNYLQFKNYESAIHLISKTNFPEGKAYNELIRYLYYTGKIKAVQMEYADSFARLMQAIRKAPETKASLGFRVTCQKLAIVVELLMGEIPDRNIFSQTEFTKFLHPYYKLVQAVLHGNLGEFNSVVQTYKKVFVKDDLLNLIARLHQNVIKTGLRRINLSYSKISFKDIADKLQLDDTKDVEFIVAKAIRDGVMNAVIDHSAQSVTLKEREDLYATQDPENAFRRRIEFCFNVHNAATKALQYPLSQVTTYEEEKPDYDPEELIKMIEEEDLFD